MKKIWNLSKKWLRYRVGNTTEFWRTNEASNNNWKRIEAILGVSLSEKKLPSRFLQRSKTCILRDTSLIFCTQWTWVYFNACLKFQKNPTTGGVPKIEGAKNVSWHFDSWSWMPMIDPHYKQTHTHTHDQIIIYSKDE